MLYNIVCKKKDVSISQNILLSFNLGFIFCFRQGKSLYNIQELPTSQVLQLRKCKRLFSRRLLPDCAFHVY